ncbi:hypothetical protein BDA96_10G073500 [Sorghum bicolor]|uniref:Peptidase S9A N-terminal domain-containing protein n=1 Tax=Sorghum bicolor TaxID=4558 RepID=A0A921U076_SORBI|nr:hypothetical protein BDA96_10G073500 [Sorghum bicolor]
MLRLAGSFPPLAASTLSRRRTLLLLLLSSFGIGAFSCYRGASFVEMAAAPPVAKKVLCHIIEHGNVRVDNYYWLRDDFQSDLDVLAHLCTEDNYTAAIMSGQSGTL